MWYKVKKQDVFGRPKTTTSKSKGKWYVPVTTDKRDMGARKKNMMSQGGHKQGGRRGKELKFDFEKLAKGVISENKSIYNNIEHDLFKTSNDVGSLIRSLEMKIDEAETQ
jgi:hypothetical protein